MSLTGNKTQTLQRRPARDVPGRELRDCRVDADPRFTLGRIVRGLAIPRPETGESAERADVRDLITQHGGQRAQVGDVAESVERGWLTGANAEEAVHPSQLVQPRRQRVDGRCALNGEAARDGGAREAVDVVLE